MSHLCSWRNFSTNSQSFELVILAHPYDIPDSTATMDECNWKNGILWCWIGRGALEGGVCEVIRGQGIPVNAIIKVGYSKSPLIRRYCGAASGLK